MAAEPNGRFSMRDAVLEQQRHRRVPYAFVGVVGDDQGDRAVRGRGCGCRIAARTSASSGPMTRSRSSSVLDGAMCSSGMSLAGGRQPVLDQAVMGELGQLLDADAGAAQDLHGRPGPERVVFFAGEVAAQAGAGVLGPDPLGRIASARHGAASARPR